MTAGIPEQLNKLGDQAERPIDKKLGEQAKRPIDKNPSAAAQALDADAWTQLFDAGLEPLLLLDAEARVVLSNHAAAEFFDRAPSSMMGQSFCTLLNVEQNSPEERALCLALESAECQLLDWRMGRRSLVLHISPMLDRRGADERRIVVLREQTRLRDTEQELQRSVSFLDSMLETNPDLVLIKDAKELRCLRTNGAGERWLGRSMEELVGKDDLELFGADYAERSRQADLLALEQGHGQYVTEETLPTALWGERIVRSKRVPISGMHGEIEYLLCIYEDITQRRRVEDDLQEIAGLLRMAGHMTRLGGWSYEPALQRLVWSDEVASIHEVSFGYSPTVESALRFHLPEHQACFASAWNACLQRGEPFDLETELLTARGRRIWVRNTAEANCDAAGAVLKIHGATQEITERKVAEQERQKLLHQLLASQKLESIGRLAGGVAHDFNNLLSVVLGYTGFILEEVGEDDPIRDDLLEIKQAGERAATLTRQLLAFSRKQILSPEALDLNQVMTGLQSMLKRILGEDIQVQVKLQPQLPKVMADPAQIEQVVLNLAVNARDAMPDGGRLSIDTQRVHLDEDSAQSWGDLKPGHFVRITIADTGVGMDEETRAQIFEPFFSTKGRERGSGLGLSIVHGVVAQSGGTIVVDSQPGVGTAFHIFLPQVEETALSSPTPAKPVRARCDESILLVEDEDAVRRLAERILRQAGYRVYSASNGLEAEMIFETLGGRIDLLLSDVVMPHLSGPELAKRLVERLPSLRTVFMSGYTDKAIVKDSLQEPGTVLVSKPFTAQELTHKLRERLERD
ncbi:MAG: PAS domain-containing protein [Myxococcota bacterium]|jgi:PAS domain S-box-containing protein|nr:PAS domain-containing protein [Myxococcota bacterium]